MRVNIFAEDILSLKYIGCSTVAKTLYKQLSRMPDIDVSWNSGNYDFDVVHYHTFGPLSLLNRKYSHGVKILTAHSTPRVNEGNLAFSRSINSYYPDIYRKFDHIINVSVPCQREIEQMLPDIPTTLIPNGIDRDFFKRDENKRKIFREKLNIEDDEKVVLTVAQQTTRKGIYDFIKLSRMYPEIRWIWIGGVPYGALSKDYFQIKLMKSLCGDNTIFTGFIPDIIEAYSGSDVFFMPSYAETFGLVILEALACDLPVVARGIPEFRNIFGDMVHFFNNIKEAAAQITDDDSLRRYSVRSRAFTEQYDIKNIANMHCSLYRKLIET
ncbi:D-inositol-3-phosphate glycosyltransferase [uncultured archaeon]|nr:D-inositol-3-phosphate glycosyltransferase [uncultured archaeon]